MYYQIYHLLLGEMITHVINTIPANYMFVFVLFTIANLNSNPSKFHRYFQLIWLCQIFLVKLAQILVTTK